MSCNAPLLAIPSDEYTDTGKKKFLPIGAYDRFKDMDISKIYPGSIKIPCGKCAGCRAAKAKAWADRMILELDHSKKAVFLTLTYDEEHLPVMLNVNTGLCESTLVKRDLQLFMKRLRKFFKGKELRYYGVGEYGSHTKRPHYHLILYGVGLVDFRDLTPLGHNELKQRYFKSDFLAQEIWKNGFCLIADVSWNTCAYVARYVKKKDYGLVSDEYVDRTVQPEFSVMSRNPGIGMYYPQEHDDFADWSKYYFSDQNGSVEVFFPPSFLRYLEDRDPDRFVELKQQRSDAARNRDYVSLVQSDLTLAENWEIRDLELQSTREVIDYYRGL